MSNGQSMLVKRIGGEVEPQGAKFSTWAEESLRKLKVADVEGRKRIAEELRAEMRTAVDCLVAGERSLFETMCIIEIERLYRDMGYRSTAAWVQEEVVPLIESKRKIRMLKAAAREYVRLREWFGEAKPQWTVLHLLDAETLRQSVGKGLLSKEEYKAISKGVAEGQIGRRALQRRLVEARADRQREREAMGGHAGTKRVETASRSTSSRVQEAHAWPLAVLEATAADVVADTSRAEAPQELGSRLAAVCAATETAAKEAEPLAMLGFDRWATVEAAELAAASERLEDAAAVLEALSRVLASAKSADRATAALRECEVDDELSRLEREVRGRRAA